MTPAQSIITPAYKGTSTSVELFIKGSNISEGTEISLDYRKELLHTDGYLESKPLGIELIPEQRRLTSQRTVKGWEVPEKIADSNLTVNVSPDTADGDYYITVDAKYRGSVVGSSVLSFKVGKGFNLSPYSTGRKHLPERFAETEKLLHLSTMNIDYSRAHFPPLNETEKSGAIAIAANNSYLKEKKYKITEIISEFHEFENFSGFFPVVTADTGEPEKPGEIVSFTIDIEEKKVLMRAAIPRKPVQYLSGEAFDELAGNLTKNWDAENFAGFWRDPETNISTETLIINQKTLNNTHRVIEKYSLVYATKPLSLDYRIHKYTNQTPCGTNGFYSAAGWLGEKYVLLNPSKLAKIILEQNATDVKTMHTGESWNLGEGYRLFANSIEVPFRGYGQAWITFFKDNKAIHDIVLPNNSLYRYPEISGTPVLVTYTSNIYRLPHEDVADLKYTWLMSQNITEIREGDVFGIMEVTAVRYDIIELRNREQIDLAAGTVLNLMGDINIQVGKSGTGLLFYPTRRKT